MGDDRYGSSPFSHTVPTERERLRLLEDLLDPRTVEIINHCDPRPSWRCLDLGAGGGSIAGWLAERCPRGTTVAADIDTRFLDPASSSNLEVYEIDVRHDDLPGAPFDLIHIRALLVHLPEREAVLAKAAAALRPGGWLVVEEPVALFSFDLSPHPGWRRLWQAFNEFERANLDTRWPRKRLIPALREAGLINPGLSVYQMVVGGGGTCDEFWRVFLTQLGTPMIEAGLLTSRELAEGLALLDTEPFVDLASQIFSTWAQRTAHKVR